MARSVDARKGTPISCPNVLGDNKSPHQIIVWSLIEEEQGVEINNNNNK